ncbi:hypothetical protein FPQ18DRAFT_17147 [Pyronema domesticum]|nr:hypothetical protein FPQ18DRAFT_17147 [Pyronema domesticum]
MTIREAEQRLGIRINEIKAVSVDIMLANAQYSVEADAIKETKERVYRRIVEYLNVEGYPDDANPDFKEANVSDLIYSIIGPSIYFMRKKTECMIRLAREKEIISIDNEAGGTEEFVVLDFISVTKEKFVFIIEAKTSSIGQAKKQVLLAMKDARDNNGGGTVYAFVTTGERWQMLSYDGKGFCLSRKMTALFEGMDEDKELWMKDCSVHVGCIVVALNNGDTVKKDVVVA